VMRRSSAPHSARRRTVGIATRRSGPDQAAAGTAAESMGAVRGSTRSARMSLTERPRGATTVISTPSASPSQTRPVPPRPPRVSPVPASSNGNSAPTATSPPTSRYRRPARTTMTFTGAELMGGFAGSRRESVDSLFRAVVAADPTRPLLTWYDDATGERTELSGATLDNWVAKTANLLVDGCGLGPGDRAAVLLPPHWQTAAVLLGCWSAGLDVAFSGPGPADV